MQRAAPIPEQANEWNGRFRFCGNTLLARFIYVSFYREGSPNFILSYHYPCQLVVGDTYFLTPEHYYLALRYGKKGGLNKDIATAKTLKKVMKLAARFNKDIKKYPIAKLTQVNHLLTVTKARFAQDLEFKAALMRTGKDIILYDNYDQDEKFLGCGLSYDGDNALGRALMTVRVEEFASLHDIKNIIRVERSMNDATEEISTALTGYGSRKYQTGSLLTSLAIQKLRDTPQQQHSITPKATDRMPLAPAPAENPAYIHTPCPEYNAPPSRQNYQFFGKPSAPPFQNGLQLVLDPPAMTLPPIPPRPARFFNPNHNVKIGNAKEQEIHVLQK